ncbi:MAG: bi-domain-containing oxidoreductase [Candidatus Eisenbacteria bacterium]|uniref:Bi-domain-containing oxidoreductase n=1 Tax=Eiseniibacteriota bacterium TaxID=2212470 RepID=A0A937X7A8_UNCEI|nr:bi-domain-containing oxidoreductase [Candidatus Eisenbacteria bacterium]
MKQLLFQGGRPLVADAAPPGLAPGRVEVELHYSAVSPGTEGGLLGGGGRSLLSRAIEKRARVDRLWAALRRRDFADIAARLRRLSAGSREAIAPGYSAAGVVRAVGPGVSRFAPGDRVAAAGAGYAAHAEIVSVPENLVVPVPAGLGLAPAATVALGAIALHSVRRADARIGERALVLGLGLLGQMTARILLASGCRVLGWDPRPERRSLAAECGVEIPEAETIAELPSRVQAATGGHGADQAIVAAAAGAEATSAAARATRRGGVLVLLGDTPVSVERAVAYERELNIRLSTSYGPGRYDPSYEEEGHDYPFAYVRWTENRNLSAWLELLAEGRVTIDDLIASVRDLDQAADTYVELRAGTLPSLGLLWRYPAALGETGASAPASSAAASAAPALSAAAPSAPASSAAAPPAPASSAMAPAAGAAVSIPAAGPARAAAPRVSPCPRRPLPAPVSVAMIGTGDYARGVLLPVLAGLGGEIRLELLAGTTPARRDPLARQFGFARVVAEPGAAAVDAGVDLVVIATRHDSHADLAAQALDAGKAVYCEKPLALTLDGLERLAGALAPAGEAFLVAGFNRRCAPGIALLREQLARRRGPLQIAYRVQAGPLPAGHWIRGAQGGGRLIGEGVHMIDLCRALVGAPLERASVLPGGGGADEEPAADNFVLGLRYGDGSTATILYTSRGASAHPKERIELHWDGRTLELDDFRRLSESGRFSPLWQAPAPRKGQAELWRACVSALREGKAPPTPVEEVLEASRAAIVLEQARRGA